jgi:hypothetical protein
MTESKQLQMEILAIRQALEGQAMTELTRAQIEAALKAVFEKHGISIGSEAILTALTAAAGVDWCEQGKGKLVTADAVRIATIERCAQVAIDRGASTYLIAAIRALKEKP